MARLLALEWDRREARVAVASRRGSTAVIEQAFAVDLGPRSADQPLDAQQIGERLAAAFAARRVGKCETLVGVGRANIELRRITLPPAPPEELPEMVRFQALREFTSVSEDWLIDFAPMEGIGGDMTNVLAAAISPRLTEQIQATCEAAGIAPRRLTLRPFAAASLLARSQKLIESESTLLIDLLAEEADLTVLLGDTAGFVRTVLLSPAAEVERRADNLVAEIRRTMGAAQNQLDGRRVSRAVLCGDGQEHAALRERLQSRLELPTDIFDPFAAVELGPELSKDHPEHPGRYAPLLGMLAAEAAGERPAIDFLQPRQAPKSRSRRQTALLAGAAALLPIGLGAFWIWSELASLDSEVRARQATLAEADKTVKSAEEIGGQVAEIDQFAAGNIHWLKELGELSRDFPAPDQVVLSSLTVMVRNEGAGQVTVDGRAKTSSIIPQIERSLSDGRRQVSGPGGQVDPSQTAYPWRFQKTIVVPAVDPTGEETEAPEL